MRRLTAVIAAAATTALALAIAAPSSGVAAPSLASGTVPIPKPGNVIVRSYPYSQSVPSLPTRISGTSRLGTWRTTLRLFEGDEWAYVDEWRGPSANYCNDYVWAVRWRSANPDVTITAGAYAIPDLTLGKAKPGGAGYISGTSCNAPEFRFGSAINGNQSNLVDVNLEWRVWTVEPSI